MSHPAATARSTTPGARYRDDLRHAAIAPDPVQAAAVRVLDRLHRELSRPPRGWRRLLPAGAPPEPVKGLYLWGNVGRGKTYLMDLLYATLPFQGKTRTHFHRFMRGLHERLTELHEVQDPLATVARDIARRARVLCLDEFLVADITDAMLLARLLEHLFEGGVTLVATSNVRPDDLYRDGLQRARFLPAIELLKRHLEVLHLDGSTDYRLRTLDRAPTYHCPAGADAEHSLARAFRRLAGTSAAATRSPVLELEGRPIRVRGAGEGVLWADFDALCRGPRSQNDYLEIARCYHTVLISAVPLLGRRDEDAARRFIHLVDVFYDRAVKLILSAAGQPRELYRGARLQAEFRRTISRLEEMQSRAYLAGPHRP